MHQREAFHAGARPTSRLESWRRSLSSTCEKINPVGHVALPAAWHGEPGRLLAPARPGSLPERIKIAANKRDMPYQSLIKAWLAERLDRAS